MLPARRGGFKGGLEVAGEARLAGLVPVEALDEGIGQARRRVLRGLRGGETRFR